MDDLPPTHPSRRRHRSRVRPRGSAGMFGSPPPAEADESSPMSCLLGGDLAGGMTGGRQQRQTHRRRRAQAAASAFLALCALIVLSGDLIHLPGLHTALSTLMSTSRRRLAEDSSSTTEDLIPVSGVRTATFFLPVEPHLKYNNKMNSHYSLPQYAQGLANTCQFLNKLDHPAYVLGDQDFITGRAQTCQELNAEEAGNYNMEELKHKEAAAMVQRHMCRRKFATDKHDPRRILKPHGKLKGCTSCLTRLYNNAHADHSSLHSVQSVELVLVWNTQLSHSHAMHSFRIVPFPFPLKHAMQSSCTSTSSRCCAIWPRPNPTI